MKSVVASLFLAGLAAAGPMLDRRAVVTTEVVHTVWTTTTVWIDPTAIPSNIFAEQNVGGPPSSVAAAVPTSIPAPAKVEPVPSPAQPEYKPPVVSQAAAPVVAAAPAAAPAAPAAVSGALVRLTYYNVAMGTTSCGVNKQPSQKVAALRPENMPNSGNPNLSPSCGRKITITNPATGKTVSDVEVWDTCPDCHNVNDVDVSTSVFQELVGSSWEAQGTAQVSWVWQ